MPEGHTIHRIARDHRKWFVGERLSVASPQGRFAGPASQLDGTVLDKVDAHGKHLFYWWQPHRVVHVHLGLYGKFRVHRVPVPEPRGAVRLRVVGESRGFDLNGPTACELLTAEEVQSIKDRLGVDPLDSRADPDRAWDRIRRSRAAIGKLLLDQSVIAGIGNVYRAEALFVRQISPERRGRDLEQEEFSELWKTIVDMLKVGVRYNRIITAAPERVGKPRSRMNRHERLLCYKKPHCIRCGESIRVWELGARKMYACPTCQT